MLSHLYRSKRCRILLLAAFWQIATVAGIHAKEAWVITHTHATVVKSSHSNLVTLATADHPAIDASHVVPLEESQPLHIVVSLSLRNRDQLQSFIQGINDPASPNYHKYLTPDKLKAE